MSSDFEWNKRPDVEPDLHQIALEKAWGAEGMLAHCLVDISAAFEELEDVYLSQEQRHKIAARLKTAYLRMQTIGSHSADPTLTAYLVAVGSIAVATYEGESHVRTESLLESLSNDRLPRWVDRFYSARHRIEENPQLSYRLVALDAERAARENLMHYLEDKESL